MADENEKIVKEIDITELFKAPVDVKINSSLDDIIQDAINQFINPDTFIEVAVYTNDLAINGNGRIPIMMDWEHRKIILPEGVKNSYFYLAIYIDRLYVNSKVIEFTKADKNRVNISDHSTDFEKEASIRERYDEEPNLNDMKMKNSAPKSIKGKKAKFIVNR